MKDRWASSSEDEAPSAPAAKRRRPRSPSPENPKVASPAKPKHLPLLQRNPSCSSVHDYSLIGRLGEGTYGVVYKAKHKKTGKVMALKRVKMPKALCAEGVPATTLREINVLLSLGVHEGIVGVHEMAVEDTEGDDNEDETEANFGGYKLYMVMDFWEHELRELMEKKPQPFMQSEVKTIMLQLLRAMEYVHSCWFIHRDLKTSNILYNNDGRVAICDFGLARRYEDPPVTKYTSLVVTLHYRAPELLIGTSRYSSAVDMWSIGCIFGELLQNKVLFYAQSETEQLKKIAQVLGTPKGALNPYKTDMPSTLDKLFPDSTVTSGPYLSQTGKDLLRGLLCWDPKKRLSAKEALQHEWFNEFPKAKELKDMPKFFSTYKRYQHGDDTAQQNTIKQGLFANSFQM